MGCQILIEKFWVDTHAYVILSENIEFFFVKKKKNCIFTESKSNYKLKIAKSLKIPRIYKFVPQCHNLSNKN